MVSGDLTIFSLNRSFLFRNRIMEVDSNHRLLQMESNNFILSFIRFYSKCGVENTHLAQEKGTLCLPLCLVSTHFNLHITSPFNLIEKCIVAFGVGGGVIKFPRMFYSPPPN